MTENDIVCCSQKEPGAMLQALRDKQMLQPEVGSDCLLLQWAWRGAEGWGERRDLQKHVEREPKRQKASQSAYLPSSVILLSDSLD
ncbi:hypothetical protein AOLI_G00048620 [Acnodon oligacanthus]